MAECRSLLRRLHRGQKPQHHFTGQFARAGQLFRAAQLPRKNCAKGVLVGHVEHAHRHHDLVQFHHVDAGPENALCLPLLQDGAQWFQ